MCAGAEDGKAACAGLRVEFDNIGNGAHATGDFRLHFAPGSCFPKCGPLWWLRQRHGISRSEHVPNPARREGSRATVRFARPSTGAASGYALAPPARVAFEFVRVGRGLEG